MAGLTREKIFLATEASIKRKGLHKTTLSDIAKELGVTHAALYKHYKNKEDLMQQLALRWLDTTSLELLRWEGREGISPKEDLHDWLWLLATTKKELYKNDKKMFRLYTDYLESTQVLVNDHLKKLAEKVESICGIHSIGPAVIKAFVYFHNPYFADRWDSEAYQDDFEALWSLVANQVVE
ncbi:TetR family transcriptional regulator [Exiguobacterium sp. s22]|uniref:TetR family transcriptional regulator n=1 Tax=Exiguobacterium sp. s22 TaxID=2751272 RepID=UPI001BE6F737|nr:TetR family transcriptional regulator [Exiguobacterium sp. s22]